MLYAASFALLAMSVAQPCEAAVPIIISTDPGIDDSIALMISVSKMSGVDLKAVAIDFGSLSNMTQLHENALEVLALMEADNVPVYVGASLPLSAPFHDLGGPLFHGVDGLGGVRPASHPTHTVNSTVTAPEMIVEACRTWDTPPVLVSLAPLANIAIALNLEPRLPELCPDLYIMGGTLAAAGNVSPIAEANIANDAEAASKVFAAGFKLRVAGLDVTMTSWLDDQYLSDISKIPNKAGPFIYEMTRFYVNAYKVHGGYTGGMPLHDPSAILMLIRPDLYTFEHYPAYIDTDPYPDATRGLVVADRRGGPASPPSNSTTQFAMLVNVSGVKQQLYNMISSLP